MITILRSKFFLLISLSLFWGAQFLLLKQGVDEMPVIFVATIRALLASGILLFLCILLKLKSNGTPWAVYLFLAFFEGTLPFLLLTYGSRWISSSLASILMGVIPLMTVIWSLLFIPMFRLNRYIVTSIILGFLGLILICYHSVQTGDAKQIFGISLILIAASCFGFGMVMVKKYVTDSSLIVARNILLMTALELFIILLIGLTINHWYHPIISSYFLPIDMQFFFSIPVNSWISIVILSLFSTGIAYLLFMTLIQTAGPQFASLTNYLTPVIGVLLGFFILNEPIYYQQIVGLSMISLAIIMMNKQ